MNLNSELLDVYDACCQLRGCTKPRHLIHQDGDWHKTFHCWVIYTDNSGQEMIVLQKRGADVELWPDKLDITSAGHYRAGEDVEGGVREVQEELGLAIRQEDLIYAGIRVCADEFQPGIKDYEFQDVYFLIHNAQLLTYAPQIEELAGLVTIPITQLLQLLTHEIENLTVQAAMFSNPEHPSRFQCCQLQISQTDFIPSLDRYYQRVALTAQRILRGEPYICI